MDRRFVIFLILSFLALMFNSIWVASRQPRREAKQPWGDGQAVIAEFADDAKPGMDAGAEAAGAEDQPEGEKKTSDTGPSNRGLSDEGPMDAELAEAARAPAAEQPVAPQRETPLQYLTLGSVASDSPFRLMATFTNHGAAVRRVELSSPRFLDLQDRSGYLGHLESVDDLAGGVRVRVVGDGTPAAAAGLQPGDRIIAAGVGTTKTVDSVDELKKVLASTKPRQKLLLQVERGEAAAEQFEVLLVRCPLDVIRPESENVMLWAKKLPKGFAEPPSFLLTLEQLDTDKLGIDAEELAGVSLREANWEVVDHDATSVTFRRLLPARKIEITKRYRLAKTPASQQANPNYPAYSLQLEIEIRNLATATRSVAYRLDGPNGLPMEGWWYANKIGRSWGASGLRDVVARSEGGDTVQFSPTQVINDTATPLEGNPLAYIGVDAQYFAAMLLPEKPQLSDEWISESRSILLGPEPPSDRAHERRYANVSCRLVSKPFKLEAGKTLRHGYTIYAGPKRTDLLASYKASGNPQYNLGGLLYYGWFSGVAKAMLGILHFFYGLVGNYGIAIILLTVMVRGCLFPLSRKQAASMAKMQQLKPEMDRLKEKYKGDMQKQSQATQELYRKHKINPMAGCLPMLIQLPVFVGLYRSLMVDVELRQAPLLSESIRWCSNLAAPDMFFDWSSWMPDFITSGVGIFGLGPYLNILPLVTVGLFLLQQQLFMPEAANEQAAMQQKIMKYMMVFMGLMFFKVASGLCLYFIASSAWGIAERKLIPAPTAAPAGGSSPSGGTTASTGKSKAGFAAVKNGQAPGKRRSKSKRKK